MKKKIGDLTLRELQKIGCSGTSTPLCVILDCEVCRRIEVTQLLEEEIEVQE